MRAAVQSPATLYPGLVGFLGGVSAGIFGAGPVTLGLLAGGALIAAGGWAFEYFARGGEHARKYLEQHQARLEHARRAAIQRLKGEFESFRFAEGTGQLDLFDRKFKAFQEVLSRKLSIEELSFHRYKTMTEQIYLNGLDNLEQVAVTLHAAAGIDEGQLRKRIEEEEASQEIDTTELALLKSRRTLAEDYRRQIEALLLKNEEALTRLDQVSAGLVSADLRNKRASMAMDDAIVEVMRLIRSHQE